MFVTTLQPCGTIFQALERLAVRRKKRHSEIPDSGCLASLLRRERNEGFLRENQKEEKDEKVSIELRTGCGRFSRKKWSIPQPQKGSSLATCSTVPPFGKRMSAPSVNWLVQLARQILEMGLLYEGRKTGYIESAWRIIFLTSSQLCPRRSRGSGSSSASSK